MMEAWRWITSLLGGCGVESEMQEAISLLQSLIEAYSAGDVTDTELELLGKDLCTGIVNLATRCRKTYSTEQCLNDLKKVVQGSLTISALKERIRKKLRSKSSTASSGGTEIF